ncbi:TonB-dependent receptor [Henriciella litoralis]|uniref:TonB-dependent receptor n=1 Tax=Henriciella litoralis TaxID=568102 RepID=UPI000A04F1FF|nr:TonB-dependent receptor [Henriciella litoralis]
MSFKTLLTGSAALSLLAISSPAFAQETQDTEARLAPVTVTAQRVEEDLQDVPISITSISGEKLDNLKAGGADVRFLSARVPSVIAESSFGRAFPRFYIRGIGNIDFDLNASQPVSMVYDDVPYENPILKGFPVFDIEAIEVLRGPQGTLFGRNTPGGIIKFDSVKPGDEFDAYIRASIGSHNTQEIEGAVGGRLNPAVAMRVSGLYQHRDDFVDNAYTNQKDQYEGFDEYAGRVQVLLTPFDDTFSALLNLHARKNDGTTRLFRANIITQGERGTNNSYDFETVYYDGQNFLEQETAGATLKLEKALSDSLTLTYVGGYETAEISSLGDIDGGFGAAYLGAGNFGPGNIPFSSETGGRLNDLTQITHEIRLAYDGGGKLRAQTGVFFFDEDLSITSVSYDSLTPGNPLNGQASREGETESVGIFASVSYDVTDRLTLSGGARYTDEDKTFAVARQLSPSGAGPFGPVTGDVSDEQVSWDISASYAATEDVDVYARIARGFRGPSIQGRLVFGNTVSIADSESVISYETGVKTELLQNRLRANAGVYYYELKDQQLTAVGGQTNTVALFNADKGEGYGFEADIEAAPLENLLLTAGLSYNHTEIKDAGLMVPVCGAPCTVTDPLDPVTGSALVDGNSFPNAPEWIANFTGRYAIPFEGGELYAYTDWAYKGETNFFLYDSIEFGEDGYWTGGLRLGWAGENGLDLSVFGRNITDEQRLAGAIDFNNLAGYVTEPLSWGVEVRYDF